MGNACCYVGGTYYHIGTYNSLGVGWRDPIGRGFMLKTDSIVSGNDLIIPSEIEYAIYEVKPTIHHFGEYVYAYITDIVAREYYINHTKIFHLLNTNPQIITYFNIATTAIIKYAIDRDLRIIMSVDKSRPDFDELEKHALGPNMTVAIIESQNAIINQCSRFVESVFNARASHDV